MLARPASKSLPIIFSMFMNTDITLNMYGWRPSMTQVTFVESPWGASVNSAVLWAANGLKKSSWIATRDDGDDSLISIRPWPTFLFPAHSYTSPLPVSSPEYVRFKFGSIFSQGDQEVQLRKSLMRGKIRSGGALMVAARWMRNASGLVAA